MARFRKSSVKEEAELNITSFMNLMIVLVPVLLLNMVFTHTAVLEIKLPPASDGSTQDDSLENKQIELIIREDMMKLNFPAGIALSQFPKVDGEYDYKGLSEKLQQLKQTLANKDVEKKDILILSEPDTDYQTLVSTMDAVRSYETVMVTDVVDAELFPDISLGDAPDIGGAKQ